MMDLIRKLFGGQGGGEQLQSYNKPMERASEWQNPGIPSPFEAMTQKHIPTIDTPFDKVGDWLRGDMSDRWAIPQGGRAPTGIEDRPLGDSEVAALSNIIRSNPGYVPGERESTNVEDRRNWPMPKLPKFGEY